MMLQFVVSIARIRSSPGKPSANGSQKDAGVIQLFTAQQMLELKKLADPELTSLNECTQMQSPFFNDLDCNPAIRLRTRCLACLRLKERLGSAGST